MKKYFAIAILLILVFAVSMSTVLAETPVTQSFDTIGGIVAFGRYEQDGNEENGPEKIEWVVLDVQDGKVLLLSKYGLEAKRYNKKKTDVTWETCTLRAWLNDDFLNKAFDAEEQSAILTTEVDNSDAQGYSGWITSGGNNTKDNIFLLSCAEISLYLDAKYMENDDGNNTASRIAPTEYAIENGAWFDDKFQTADGRPSGWWWLRSPGGLQSEAAFVTSFGSFFDDSIIDGSVVVRPAFWLNLESDIF